jgi:hypothetical protein
MMKSMRSAVSTTMNSNDAWAFTGMTLDLAGWPLLLGHCRHPDISSFIYMH